MRQTMRTDMDREPRAARPDASAGRSARNDVLQDRWSPGNSGIVRRPWFSDYSLVLTVASSVCYGSRLSSRLRTRSRSKVLQGNQPIRTIFDRFCHELYWVRFVLYLLLGLKLQAQTY